MLFVSFICLAILTIFNYQVAGKRITYPPFLFCGIWLFLLLFRLVFTQFYLKDYYPIYAGTYWLFIAGGLVSSIAGYLMLLQHKVFERAGLENSNQEVASFNIANVNTFNARLVLFIAVLLIFPFYIKHIAGIVIASQVENIFKSIRYETTVEGQGFGIYSYVITLAAFFSLTNGYAYWKDPSKKNKYIYIFSLIVALLYAVCTMGRTPILTVIAFNIGLYIISSKRIRLFRLARYTLLFCVLFIVMGVLMDKGGDLNSSFTENVDRGVENLGLYITSPMNAINEVLYGQTRMENGLRTFRFFYVLANSLGFISIDPDRLNLVDDFVFVPYDVNVYTYYNPYVRDFGWLFSLFFLFIFMAWHSWSYAKALTNKRAFFPTIIYSFLFYPLVMSIFNDQYASLFSTWLQLFAFAGLYYLCIKMLAGKKNSVLQLSPQL